jgi:type I restriction-modification system DNA methylase subunit
MFYAPPAILAALRGYQPSAGTGGFLLQAPANDLVLSNPPFSMEASRVQR